MPTFESAPDVLGQEAPAATTLTDITTGADPVAPDSNGGTRIDTLFCCNRDTSPTAIRISVAIGGAADDPSQYLVYDGQLGAKETFVLPGPIYLAATDVLRVYSVNGLVSFNAFGQNYA